MGLVFQDSECFILVPIDILDENDTGRVNNILRNRIARVLMSFRVHHLRLCGLNRTTNAKISLKLVEKRFS